MSPEWRLFPERASALAERVDDLFLTELVTTSLLALVVAVLIFYWGVKYRRRHHDQVGQIQKTPSARIEIVWSIVLLGIVLAMFYAGVIVFFDAIRPPANADTYFVVGRQWMWKIQHPDGRSEINELHVPVNRPIKLLMTSEDVIHSFFVPAFRAKSDVLPGRYTTVWFNADRLGTYHLFCAEYCGTDHSRMIGRVIVMDPHQYEDWLSGVAPGKPLAASGEEIFTARGCTTCHRSDTAARAPILTGLAGSRVRLLSGDEVTADETYIRESIVEPAAKVVAGYQPVMPAYKGQLTEEELVQLISYIGSLKSGPARAPGGAPTIEGPPTSTPPAQAPEGEPR